LCYLWVQDKGVEFAGCPEVPYMGTFQNYDSGDITTFRGYLCKYVHNHVLKSSQLRKMCEGSNK